jgi:hypothetical protein
MKLNKFRFLAAGVITSLILFSSGCKQKPGNTNKTVTEPNVTTANVKLTFKFTQGKTQTYRLQTLAQRKVSLEGPQPENTSALFQGGQTTDKIDMVFSQQVQSINAQGNAIEKITIKELKYFAEVKDKTALDFDSQKDKDPNNALFAFIGQSYNIEVSPSGKVTKIIDANHALAALSRFPTNNDAAIKLLSDNAIEKRHSIPLPDLNANELNKGSTWSSITNYDFGLMGKRAYDRTYTLDTIEKTDGTINAAVSMNAIPSIEGTKEAYEEQKTSTPPMTDIRQSYTGQMKIDITDGTLLKYEENLKNEWIVVPPGSGKSGPPSALNMTATQIYDIEKINNP